MMEHKNLVLLFRCIFIRMVNLKKIQFGIIHSEQPFYLNQTENYRVSVKPEGGLKKSSGYERIERGFHRLPSSRCESMGVSAIEPGRAIDSQGVS